VLSSVLKYGVNCLYGNTVSVPALIQKYGVNLVLKYGVNCRYGNTVLIVYTKIRY